MKSTVLLMFKLKFQSAFRNKDCSKETLVPETADEKETLGGTR